jgi:hypothetical protein
LYDGDLTWWPRPVFALATSCRSKQCGQILLVSPFPGAYLGCFGRKRFALRTITSIHFFALEAAKLVLAFIFTRDRLSAAKTEGRLALIAKERSFAIKAESLLTLFTPERIFAITTGPLVAHFAVVELFAVEAECLVALVTALITDENIFALKTEGRLTIFLAERIFTLTT